MPPPASPDTARGGRPGVVGTRERILDAALDLTVRRGFGGLTLRSIATTAGLSTPGLLRHFRDKDEVLLALLARTEDRNAAWIRTEGVDVTDLSGLLRLAEHAATSPGWLALGSATAAAATRPGHPAHEVFAGRYRRSRELSARALSEKVTGSPSEDAVRLIAVWDGLQLQSLYDPGLVVASELADYLSALGGVPPADRPPTPEVPPHPATSSPYREEVLADSGGYAVGRERRAEIVTEAVRLFARDGYHDTSLQAVGAAIGVPKTSLLHHFRSKEDLLRAVLLHRDASIDLAPATPVTAAEELAWLCTRADLSTRDRGLIALHTVLSGEGSAPEHPAHDHFARRLDRLRRHVSWLLQRIEVEGHLRPGVSVDHEATRFLALWDGLQLQWLYEPDAVDIGRHLRNHVRTHLVAPETS